MNTAGRISNVVLYEDRIPCIDKKRESISIEQLQKLIEEDYTAFDEVSIISITALNI